MISDQPSRIITLRPMHLPFNRACLAEQFVLQGPGGTRVARGTTCC